MESISFSEVYKSLLNLVHHLESGQLSYTIDFEKEGTPFSIDAKFNVTTNGDYALSFSSDCPISPIAFNTPLLEIHSEWYNIIFDSVNVRKRRTTYNNSTEKPDVYQIITKSFRSTINNNWNDSYICAFYKYNHSIFNPSKSCVLNNNAQPIGHNPLEIKIGECELTIFWDEKADSKEKDERYLMFFSKTKMDFSIFKEIVNAIRVTWGLITGYYIGQNVYYMSFKQEFGWDRLSFAYNNLQEEFVSYRGMLDSKPYDKIAESDLCLTANEFERLVTLLYNNESYFRAGQLLLTASNDEGLSKGGIAAIALEAITGGLEKEIKAQKNNEPNEFKVPKELREEIQNVIHGFKEKEKITKRQRDHYLKKLDGFSNPLNSDKLSIPFHLLKITLTETEKGIIENRNTLLHGNLPKKSKALDFASKLNSDELLFYVSNKLIMLCSMLLFRIAGIDKLINDWGITIIAKKRLIESGKYIGGYGNKHRLILDNSPEEDSPDWLL